MLLTVVMHPCAAIMWIPIVGRRWLRCHSNRSAIHRLLSLVTVVVLTCNRFLVMGDGHYRHGEGLGRLHASGGYLIVLTLEPGRLSLEDGAHLSFSLGWGHIVRILSGSPPFVASNGEKHSASDQGDTSEADETDPPFGTLFDFRVAIIIRVS